MTRSTKISSAIMVMIGVFLTIMGIVKWVQGEPDAWQVVALGLALPVIAFCGRAVTLRWYALVDSWTNKGK